MDRPGRDVPPLPMKEKRYQAELENWKLEYSPPSPSTEARQRNLPTSNLPPGAMPSRPPSAQYHAATTNSPLPPPRRQSSLGATSSATPSRDLSFTSPTPTTTSSVVSPKLYPTSPPQSIVSHDQSSSSTLSPTSQSRSAQHFLNSPPRTLPQHHPQSFSTPPRRSTHQASTNPPLSSSAKFARSVSSSENREGGGFDYSTVADNIVGMASSSSFYGGSPSSHSQYTTPSHSPRSSQVPQRQSSLLQRSLQHAVDGGQGSGQTTAPPIQKQSSSPLPPPFVPPKASHAHATSPLSLSPSSASPHSSPPTYNHLAAFYGSPPSNSLLSLPQNRSKQSIFDKSSSTSEDEGVLTENTSVDGFTPPSKQSAFELAPSLPVANSPPPPHAEVYQPLPMDTTPPRSTAIPSSQPQPPTAFSSAAQANHDNAPFLPPRQPDTPRQLEHPRRASVPSQIATSSPSPRTNGLTTPIDEARNPETPTRPPRNPLSFPQSPSSPVYHHSSPSSSPSRSRPSPNRATALAAARQREKQEPAQRSTVEPRKEEEEESSRRTILHQEEASARQPETKPAPKARRRSRMEATFSLCTVSILKIILPFLTYQDVTSLRYTSKVLKHTLEIDGRDLILERFLGSHGYRSYAPHSNRERHQFAPADDVINLDLRDLAVFRAAQTLTLDDYSRFSRAYVAGDISSSHLRLARATTRAWNRIVLRLRQQTLLPPSSLAPPSFPELRQVKQPVYKAPRAPLLRVWVPTFRGESWMNDSEVIECERELWRSGKGVWSALKKADIVQNVAIESFGNCGRTIFDGRFLRDLSFEFDVIGHLPSWLNMLTLSPSYFHNILSSSSSNPVFYLSLSPFVQRLQETLRIESEKVSLASPQGNYQVKKHVYRGMIVIQAGKVLQSNSTDRKGGYEVCHPDWAGKVYLETEGTTEHASLLIARVASEQATPWRVLREKCRPGRLVITPVLHQ